MRARSPNAITLDLHFGYSWSPGSTLKEIGTRSALRLAQKASQTARCTALYTTSRPVSVTKAIGRQHNSTGKSHRVGLMLKTSQKNLKYKCQDIQLIKKTNINIQHINIIKSNGSACTQSSIQKIVK